MAQDDKTRANALIDKYDGYLSGLDVAGLCHELSTMVMSYAYTVYEVFNVMSERGYSQTALEQVATDLTNRINDANLIELAKFMHGATLLARIQYLMNCQANPNQAICQRLSTAFQRANEMLREQDKRKPNDTGLPRQLSEEEIAFYTERGRNQPLLRNTKKGLKAVAESKRRLFNGDVIWELPDGGNGFITYNRNDIRKPNSVAVKIDDQQGLDQIGTKETIERVINIAREWNALPENTKPKRPLQIGDVSRPGGINTTEHSTHVGNEVDVRPQRIDGASVALNIKDSPGAYDRPLTKVFILLVRRLYPGTTVLFNDPVLGEQDSETRDFVTPSDETHWNHLHLIFP